MGRALLAGKIAEDDWLSRPCAADRTSVRMTSPSQAFQNRLGRDNMVGGDGFEPPALSV